MAVNIGDVIRVVVKMSNLAQDVQNVFHLRLSGSVAPSDAGLLSAIQSAMQTAYNYVAGFIPDEVDFDYCEVYNLTQDQRVGYSTAGTFTGGTGSGDTLPPQVAPLALFNTDALRSQGRKFLPPFTEINNEADGTLAASALVAIGNFASTFLDNLEFSQASAAWGNWNEALERFAYYTSVYAPDRWATQRRRYPGRGS